MRPTIPHLRNWLPDSASGAGEAATRIATAVDAAIDSADRALHDDGEWVGSAHDAVVRRLGDVRDHADEVRAVLQQIADEARDAGTDLAHARDYVLREVDAARAKGFAVSDLGVVRADDDSWDEEVSTISARLSHGLDVIDDLDERYGATLEALCADLAALRAGSQPTVTVDGTSRDPDDVVHMLTGMSPNARRYLLNSLTPDERRHVMQADPATIGNLDGVPFELRAAANEINIRNAIIDERQRNGGKDTATSTRLTELLRQRRDPMASDGPGDFGDPDSAPNLADPDDGLVERSFIAFQNTPNGRIVEMVGGWGPTTRNATVYVPGTGTNLVKSGAGDKTAWHLARETRGPVFYYLDGDLPQNLGYEQLADDVTHGRFNPTDPSSWRRELDGATHDTAIDPRYAREMAPRLVGFGHELDHEIAAHAPGATSTYIGHSYGGSVVGTAEQLGLRADRVVYASSAGTGVHPGGWHDANPNVVRYSMTAPGDPIQAIQSLPGNPHGHDPDTAPGVIRIDSGFHSDGAPVQGIADHGGYWNDPGSTAFQNIVRAATGQTPYPYVDRMPDDPVSGLIRKQLEDLGFPTDSGILDLPGPIPDLRLPMLPDLPFTLK